MRVVKQLMACPALRGRWMYTDPFGAGGADPSRTRLLKLGARGTCGRQQERMNMGLLVLSQGHAFMQGSSGAPMAYHGQWAGIDPAVHVQRRKVSVGVRNPSRLVAEEQAGSILACGRSGQRGQRRAAQHPVRVQPNPLLRPTRHSAPRWECDPHDGGDARRGHELPASSRPLPPGLIIRRQQRHGAPGLPCCNAACLTVNRGVVNQAKKGHGLHSTHRGAAGGAKTK